jgi:hypothetical protein
MRLAGRDSRTDAAGRARASIPAEGIDDATKAI